MGTMDGMKPTIQLQRGQSAEFTMHKADDMAVTRKARITVTANGQLSIHVEGYGDKTTNPGHGEPLFLEIAPDGKLMMRCWGDINSEDPTHTINMEGAREDARDGLLG